MIGVNFVQKIKESKILIIVHEHVTGGVAHVLRDYLLEKTPKRLVFIAHPLLYIKESYAKSSYYEQYDKGKLTKSEKAYHWRLPEPILYVKDFLYTIFWTFKTRSRYSVIIALDPLNAVAGIILRCLGRADIVVHYCIDYFPTRFQNPLMNWIYHSIDKFAVRYSDETWNLGARMVKARAEDHGMTGEEYKKRQYHVPIGVWMAKIKRYSPLKFDKNKLIYAGGFIPYMGIDLVIQALPKIIKKVPRVTLDIIGRGDAGEDWKKLAEKLGVEKRISFEDWMEEREAFHLRLSGAAIGMAPFNYNILDDKVKNADPGKIKDYTSSGLPVITTKAVYTHKQIEDAGAGIIIDYTVDSLANAVIKLLTNPKLLLEYRKNALKYAKQFDWDKLYRENLGRVLSK
ncbi:MAG: glycosyltransferase [Microgenomates group bacterium Gr01-1014_5]|nr:MAG: glycosyltransferase [Microgenomates group bacterium Gr01-1014_5]